MDTLNLTHIWGDFINYPGNITILMVELAKLKLHWNRIVSCTGIIYTCMHKNDSSLRYPLRGKNALAF